MNKIKSYITALILIFINFIFEYKYLIRITNYAFVFSLLLSLIQGSLLYFPFKNFQKIKLAKASVFVTCILILALNLLAHYKVPLESLNVDRWSIISSFFNELLNGNYPYFAKSNVGNPPGPMPIYFIIALPFYYIGNYSLLSSLGYFIILFLTLKIQYRKYPNPSYTIALFFISFFMFWEILTRSNILTYSVLCLVSLNIYVTSNLKKGAPRYLSATILGLALSTRSIYILAYIVFIIPDLLNKKRNIKTTLSYLSIAILAFASSFLPLIIIWKKDFWVMNPFIVQSTFLVPPFYILIFILFAFVSCIAIKTNNDKYFYSGLTLFLSILVYSIYHIINSGFKEAYLNNIIDISYFVFCTPFLIYYIYMNPLSNNNLNSKPILN